MTRKKSAPEGPRVRLVYAKYLIRLSESTAAGPFPFAASFAVLSLQDAVEMILRAIAAHVDAHLDPVMRFDKIIDAIRSKTKKDVPATQFLNELNSARVTFKHHGTRPASDEIPAFIVRAKAFAQDATRAFMDLDFEREVSLASVLQDERAREALQRAEDHLAGGRLAACVAECRAVYIRFAIRVADAGYPFRSIKLPTLPSLRGLSRVSRGWGLPRESTPVRQALEEIIPQLNKSIEALQALAAGLQPALQTLGTLSRKSAEHENLLSLLRRGVNLRELDRFLAILRLREDQLTVVGAQLCLSFVLDMALAIEMSQPVDLPDELPGVARKSDAITDEPSKR